jgi:hypothetical protein
MAFIAVAVPLVVVSIAAAVYFQRGRGSVYDAYMLQAQQAAEQAQEFDRSDDQQIAWQAVLDYVDLAESYRVTQDSQAMRGTARAALDSLEIVERVNYQPAIIDGLPSTVNITRIVATIDDELYLLDSIAGEVLRAVFTTQGFELDTEFFCGPVPQPLIVGPLVDILALPPGYPNGATLMGMDANGNLLHCIPGGEAPLAFPMAPPDSNWGTPQAFALDGGELYVLDPLTSSIWIYSGENEYRDLPDYFFGDQVPSMQDVVDLTVSDGNLYLLHGDGHLTTSKFEGEKYHDPAKYQDMRDGGSESATFNGVIFSEIQFAPPPDPSLYLLEPVERAIYHFSLQLVYQRQYRSQTPLPEGMATAFTVSPNHQAFLAIGNRVYYAFLP